MATRYQSAAVRTAAKSPAKPGNRATTSTHLLETVLTESLTKESVDREAGVIRGVKVLGRISRNGREYSDSAMDDAVRIYEGLKVNVDHPDRKTPTAERRFVEGFGDLRNVTKKPDGVYGDLHFKKSHPQAELVCESAERFPKSFGLSHNAEGSLVRRSGKMVVESLTSAESVDIVGKPATNEGLFESVDPTGEFTMKKVSTTVRKLIESAVAKSVEKLLRYKNAPARLTEMEGGDSALMSAPDDMMAPETADGDGMDDESNPDDLIDDAFQAMVTATMTDSTLDLAGKIARITEILTAQDSLMNGATAKPAPAATPPAGDKAVAESEQLKTLAAGIQSLIESQKQTAMKQAEQDAKFSLMESKREVLPERVTALVGAKDDAHRKLLMESWPVAEVGHTAIQKPKSGSVMESTLAEFPKDTNSFLRQIGAKRIPAKV